MGSLCGGSPTTSTQTQNQNVQFAPYGLQNFVDIYNRANQVAGIPYQPYTGELVAPMNGYQFAGVNQIMDYGQAAQPYIGAAAGQVANGYNTAAAGVPWIGQGAGNVNAGAGMIAGSQGTVQQGIGNIQGGAGQVSNAQNYIPMAGQYAAMSQPLIGGGTGLAYGGAQGVGNIGAGDISQYMNPFQNQVIGATLANMAENNAVQQQQVQGNAAMRGALGGDRLGVAQAELARQQALANNQTLAGLNAQNYNQAVQTALSQQQNQQLNQNRLLQASGQLGNLANTQMGLGNLFGGLGATSAGIGSQLAGTGNALVGAAGQQAGIGNLYAGTGMQLGSLAGQQAGVGSQLGGLGSIYGNLGLQGQNAALTGGQALLGAGTVSQQTQQALDTANYQQYLQQLAFPYQQAQFLAGIGLPAAGAMGGFQTQIGSAGQTITPPGVSWPQALVGGGAFLGSMFGKNRGGRVGYAPGGAIDVDLSDEYKDAKDAWSKPIIPQTGAINIPQHQFRSDGGMPLMQIPQASGSTLSNLAGAASAGKSLASGASALGGLMGLGGLGASNTLGGLGGSAALGAATGIGDAALGAGALTAAEVAAAEGTVDAGLALLPLLFLERGGRANGYAPGGPVYPTQSIGGGQNILDIQGSVPKMSALQSPKVYHGDFMRMTPLLNISKAASAAPGITADQMGKLGTTASRLLSVTGEEEENAARGGRMGYANGGGMMLDPSNRFTNLTSIPGEPVVGISTELPQLDPTNRFIYNPPVHKFTDLNPPLPQPTEQPQPTPAPTPTPTPTPTVTPTPAPAAPQVQPQTQLPTFQPAPVISPYQREQPADAAAFYVPPPMTVQDHLAAAAANGSLGTSPYQREQPADAAAFYVPPPMTVQQQLDAAAARGGLGVNPYQQAQIANEPNLLAEIAQFGHAYARGGRRLATGGQSVGYDPHDRFPYPAPIKQIFPDPLVFDDEPIVETNKPPPGLDDALLLEAIRKENPDFSISGSGGGTGSAPDGSPGGPATSGGLMGILQGAFPGGIIFGGPPIAAPTPDSITKDEDAAPPAPPSNPLNSPPVHPDTPPPDTPITPTPVPTETITVPTPTPALPAPPETTPTTPISTVIQQALDDISTTNNPSTLAGLPASVLTGYNVENTTVPAPDSPSTPAPTAPAPTGLPSETTSDPGALGFGLTGNPGSFAGLNAGNLGDPGTGAFAAGTLGINAGAPGFSGVGPVSGPGFGSQAPGGGLFGTGLNGPGFTSGYNVDADSAATGILGPGFSTSPGNPGFGGLTGLGFNSETGMPSGILDAAAGKGALSANSPGYNVADNVGTIVGPGMPGFGLAPGTPASQQQSETDNASNAPSASVLGSIVGSIIGSVLGDSAANQQGGMAPGPAAMAAATQAVNAGYNANAINDPTAAAMANAVGKMVGDYTAPTPSTINTTTQALNDEGDPGDNMGEPGDTGLEAGINEGASSNAGFGGASMGFGGFGGSVGLGAATGIGDTGGAQGGFGGFGGSNTAGGFGGSTGLGDAVGIGDATGPGFGGFGGMEGGSPAGDTGGTMGGAPAGFGGTEGGSPAGDTGGTMGGAPAGFGGTEGGFGGEGGATGDGSAGVGISGGFGGEGGATGDGSAGVGVSGDGGTGTGDGGDGGSGGSGDGGDGGGGSGDAAGGRINPYRRRRSQGGPVNPYNFLQGYEEGGEAGISLEDVMAQRAEAMRKAIGATINARAGAEPEGTGPRPPDSFVERLGSFGTTPPPPTSLGAIAPLPRPRPAMADVPPDTELQARPPQPVNPYAAAAAARPNMDPSQASWGDIMNAQHPMYATAAPQRKAFWDVMQNPRDRSRALMEFGARVLSADPGRGWGAAIGSGALGTMQTFDAQHDKDLSARQKAQNLAAQIKKHMNTFEEQKRHHQATEEIGRERTELMRMTPIGTTDNGVPIMRTKDGQLVNGWTGDPLTNEEKMLLGRGRSGGLASGQTERIIQEIRRENPDLSYTSAFELVKRAGHNPDMITLRREGQALAAAEKDLGFMKDPTGTYQKWREKLGLKGEPYSTPAPAGSGSAKLDDDGTPLYKGKLKQFYNPDGTPAGLGVYDGEKWGKR